MDKDFVIRSADDEDYGIKTTDEVKEISSIVSDDPLDERYMQEIKPEKNDEYDEPLTEEELNNLEKYKKMNEEWAREDEEFYRTHKFDLRPETEEEIIEHLLRSEDDIENGRVRPAEELFKEWEEKYGVLSNCVHEDEEFYSAQQFEMRPETEEEIIEHLLRSEDDIENGRVRDAREVFKEWEEMYGIRSLEELAATDEYRKLSQQCVREDKDGLKE